MRMNYRWDEFQEKIKERKELKVTIVVVIVFTLILIVQMLMNQLFFPKDNIVEAFVNSKSQISYTKLMIQGNVPKKLVVDDQKEMIYKIGEKIGLKIQSDIEVYEGENNNIVYYVKNGKNATSHIQISEVDNKSTAFVSLKVYSKPESALEYRKTIEQHFKDLELINIQSSLEISSEHRGKLTTEEADAIVEELVESLKVTLVYEDREEDNYTIYGYTGIIKEYQELYDTRVNIHLEINYVEESGKTVVHLASPVIPK